MSQQRGLTAIFSNLSKAAEKQQLAKESTLLGELAGSFSLPGTKSADLGTLREMLVADLDTAYPALREAGVAAADRGTLRAVTWGEKVSKAQRALVDRYQSQGEELLQDKSIFVCQACGFIFLGTEPPDICPVCKVPSFRFDTVR